MNTYNYYTIDCNRFEESFWKQNESNIGLKLKLKATRGQFKNGSNYFKTESYKIEQLEIVFD